MFLSFFFALAGYVFFLIALRVGAVATVTGGCIVFATYDFYYMTHQDDCDYCQDKVYYDLLYLC